MILTYITTLDFLYHAYLRKVMTLEECNQFIKEVKEKGSILPDIKIEEYKCKVQL